MLLLFSLIAITSIWCLGIKIITEEGMFLEDLGKWGEMQVKSGVKWVEPVFYCHWCMPSVHSLVGFGFAFGLGLIPELSWHLLFYYPLVAMGSSLLNGLIWQYYKNRNQYNEFIISAKETTEILSDWLDTDLAITAKEDFEQVNN